jgi:hypothetical protein
MTMQGLAEEGTGVEADASRGGAAARVGVESEDASDRRRVATMLVAWIGIVM